MIAKRSVGQAQTLQHVSTCAFEATQSLRKCILETRFEFSHLRAGSVRPVISLSQRVLIFKTANLFIGLWSRQNEVNSPMFSGCSLAHSSTCISAVTILSPTSSSPGISRSTRVNDKPLPLSHHIAPSLCLSHASPLPTSPVHAFSKLPNTNLSFRSDCGCHFLPQIPQR